MTDTNSVNKIKPLGGPGGVRPISSRWAIEGRLTLTSAAAIGGGDMGATDMPVLRDALDHVTPVIMGTSIAGALRSALDQYMSDATNDGSSEHYSVRKLFGCKKGNDEGGQSPFVTHNTLAENIIVESRDGVAIDPARGVGEDHKKYDFEVIPAGTIFPLKFELVIDDKDNEHELLSLLVTTLERLEQGDVRFGARGTRGLGACVAGGWCAVRFDLSSSDGWNKWLATRAKTAIPGSQTPLPSIRDAVNKAYAPIVAIKPLDDNRTWIKATLRLIFEESGLNVRSYRGEDVNGPDSSHIKSGGNPIVPGTSIAGALRARAVRIAATLSGGDQTKPSEIADVFVGRLFGPRSDKAGGKKQVPQTSRLIVNEPEVKGTPLRIMRNKIDRYSGGTVDTALLKGEPLFDAAGTLELRVNNPSDAERGLFLLLVKDVLLSDLSFGGEASIGRGVPSMSDSAVIAWKTSGAEPGEIVLRAPNVEDRKVVIDSPENSRALNGFVSSLHKALTAEAEII